MQVAVQAFDDAVERGAALTVRCYDSGDNARSTEAGDHIGNIHSGIENAGQIIRTGRADAIFVVALSVGFHATYRAQRTLRKFEAQTFL